MDDGSTRSGFIRLELKVEFFLPKSMVGVKCLKVGGSQIPSDLEIPRVNQTFNHLLHLRKDGDEFVIMNKGKHGSDAVILVPSGLTGGESLIITDVRNGTGKPRAVAVAVTAPRRRC